MKRLIKFSLASVILLYFMSCGGSDGNKYTDNADCSAVSATENTYTKTIKPFLDATCATSGCHDATTAAEGIRLDNYSNAKKEFVDGNSLCAVNHDCKPMPQGLAKLPTSTLNMLACWVKEGAKE